MFGAYYVEPNCLSAGGMQLKVVNNSDTYVRGIGGVRSLLPAQYCYILVLQQYMYVYIGSNKC